MRLNDIINKIGNTYNSLLTGELGASYLLNLRPETYKTTVTDFAIKFIRNCYTNIKRK